MPDLPALPRWLEREVDQAASALRRDPAKAALQKAYAAREAGRLGAALAAARLAKDAAPRSASIRGLVGTLARARGHLQEALAELQAYRRLSGDLRLEPLVADCYRALGRPERALEVASGVTRDEVAPVVWIEAQLVRAAAHGDRGHFDAAIGVLRSAESETKSEAGRRRLRAAREALEQRFREANPGS